MRAFLEKSYSNLKNACALISGLVSTYFTFFSWEELNIQNTCVKISLLVGVFITCLLSAIIITWAKRSELLWRRGSGSVNVKYGDLLGDAFNKRSIFRKIKEGVYIIPVNTHFDTIVEDETVLHPLVSKNTIHGSWLLKYSKEMGKNHKEIEQDIYHYLDGKGITFEKDLQRAKGSQRKYELGTCAIVEGKDNRSFLLVALADFDQNNNAHISKDGVITCTQKMLKFLNGNVQGEKAYIPLMGTGRSRANLSHKDSLHILVSTMDLYNDLIISPIDVIIYNKDKKLVSIFDK